MKQSQPGLSFLKDPKLIYCYSSGNNLLINTFTRIFTMCKMTNQFYNAKISHFWHASQLELPYGVSVVLASIRFRRQMIRTSEMFSALSHRKTQWTFTYTN
jgi:hypothetical protein